MNPIKKFANGVAILFKTDEEKEILALAEIERQRQTRENAKRITLRFAGLTDAVDAAKENLARQNKRLDEIPSFTPKMFAELFFQGHKIEDLAIRLVAVEKLNASLPQIKIELKDLIVGTAEKALSDFYKANQKILAKLPKLERAAEPVFVSADLPKDHYEGASAKLASNAIVK